MNHVVIGAFLPLVVCAMIYARNGGRASPRFLVLGPAAMLISGVWATVPDLPRLFGDMDRYIAWHRTPYRNVWWGHKWIDDRAALEEWAGYPVVAMVMAALVFAAAWRELRKLERR